MDPRIPRDRAGIRDQLFNLHCIALSEDDDDSRERLAEWEQRLEELHEAHRALGLSADDYSSNSRSVEHAAQSYLRDMARQERAARVSAAEQKLRDARRAQRDAGDLNQEGE